MREETKKELIQDMKDVLELIQSYSSPHRNLLHNAPGQKNNKFLRGSTPGGYPTIPAD